MTKGTAIELQSLKSQLFPPVYVLFVKIYANCSISKPLVTPDLGVIRCCPINIMFLLKFNLN